MLLTPGNPVPLLPDILPPVHLPTRYHAWYSPKVPDVTSRIWKQFLAFQTSHRSRDSDASLKVTFSATGTQPRFHQAVQRHPWLAVRRPWSWSILQSWPTGQDQSWGPETGPSLQFLPNPWQFLYLGSKATLLLQQPAQGRNQLQSFSLFTLLGSLFGRTVLHLSQSLQVRSGALYSDLSRLVLTGIC